MAATDEEVRALVYDSCLRLDQRDFAGFLGICASDFRYRISAFMPEIGKEVTVFDQTREDLQTTFQTLSQHLRLPGEYFRQATVQKIERGEAKIQATTSVLVVYTDEDGASRLFAAGRYMDSFVMETERLVLSDRHTRLQTRDLGGGSHIPF